MEFKGLVFDNKGIASTGNWLRARNIVLKSKPQPHIQNELGFEKVDDINGVVIGQIRTPNEDIYFSTNGVFDEIGIRRGNNPYEIIVRDTIFGFDIKYPIYGVFDYNHKKELVLVWTDRNKETYILNIDSLPFDVYPPEHDRAYQIDDLDRNKARLALLFPEQDVSIVSLEQVSDVGGSLKSGVYFVSVVYGLADDSFLNYGPVSNKIAITEESVGDGNFNNYDGCEGGTPTTKTLQLKLSNVDTKYTYIRIGVISQINGVISTYETSKIPITSNEFTYAISNIDTLSAVSINKILIDNIVYSKCKTLAVSNNELLLGNAEQPAQFDYQAYANNIKIKWYRNDIVSLDGILSSYKNPKVIFDKTSFKAGEVYAFYVKLNHKKGYTQGIYHIPGRDLLPGETKTVLNNAEAAKLDSLVHKFQIYDTSTGDSGYDNNLIPTGEMAYWENRNELYPEGFGALVGKNVRHHKFPTLERFMGGYKNPPFFTINELSSNESSTASGDLDTTVEQLSIPVITWGDDTPVGIFSDIGDNINTRFTASKDLTVAVTVNFEGTVDPSSFNYDVSFVIKNQSGTIVQFSVWSVSFNTIDTYSKIFSIPNNHKLEVYTDITGDPINLNIVDGNITLECLDVGAIDGTKFTRSLGVAVENIDIPIEIRDQIDSIEILYAERDSNNMTIVGQSLLFNEQGWKTDVNGNYLFLPNGLARMHPFDILATSSGVIPNYIKNELLFNCNEQIEDIPDNERDHKLIDIVSTLTIGNYFGVNQEETGDLRYIRDYKLLPANNSATEPPNEFRENCISFKIPSGLPTTNQQRYLTNLCVYKQDIYTDFTKQKLVSTGTIILINDDLSTSSKFIIYGGDTCISGYGFKRLGGGWFPIPPEPYKIVPHAIRILYFPCENYLNIGLRHENEDTVHGKYFPKTSFAELTDEELMGEADPYVSEQYTNYYTINKDYALLNKFVAGSIYYPNIDIVSKFPFRIARSNPNLQESVSLNWRTFLAGNYYEMPRTKGELWHLVAQGKVLYIMMERAIFVSLVKDVITTVNEDIYLRTGDMFDRAPEEKIPTKGGYIGNRSIFGVVLTEFGLITVDRLSGKIFHFKSIDDINEISSLGQEYFEELLKIQSEDLTTGANPILINPTAYLLATDNTPFTYSSGYQYEEVVNKIDNPVIGKGIMLAYDQSNKRLLLTVKNVERYPLDSNVDDDYEDGSILVIGVQASGQSQSSFSFFLWGGVGIGTQEVTLGCVDELDPDPDNYQFLQDDSLRKQAENIYDCIVDFIDPEAPYVVRLVNETIIIKSTVADNEYDLAFGTNQATDWLTFLTNRVSTKVVDKSETLSYSLEREVWIAKHDYVPTFIEHVSKNKGMLASIDVDVDNMISKVYYHNVLNLYGKYYYTGLGDGEDRLTHSSFMDCVFSSKGGKDFLLESLIWETVLEKNGISHWDKTLTHLAVYNEHQASNLYKLVVQTMENTLTDGNIAYHRNEWRFNKFADDLINNKELFIDKDDNFILSNFADHEAFIILSGRTYVVSGIITEDDYVVYDGIVYSINNTTFIGTNDAEVYTSYGNALVLNFKNWFEKSNFITKLAVVRAFYDNIEQYKMSLLDLRMNGKTLV